MTELQPSISRSSSRSRSGPSAALVEAIDQVQRVARNPSRIRNLPLHIHGLGLHIRLLNPIETRLVIREGGAQPRLGIAHLESKRLLPEVVQLGERLAQLVHRRRHQVHAVADRRELQLRPLEGGGELGEEAGDAE